MRESNSDQWATEHLPIFMSWGGSVLSMNVKVIYATRWSQNPAEEKKLALTNWTQHFMLHSLAHQFTRFQNHPKSLIFQKWETFWNRAHPNINFWKIVSILPYYSMYLRIQSRMEVYFSKLGWSLFPKMKVSKQGPP